MAAVAAAAAAVAEVEDLHFLVMGDMVQDVRLVSMIDGWRKVHCERQEAYGCGEDGKHIVKGLDLFVLDGCRNERDPLSSLSIRATPDVLSYIGWQIDEEMAETFGRKISVSAYIQTVARGVIVLRLCFHGRHDYAAFRTYYLVYDSIASALFLLPFLPDDCRHLCTRSPLMVEQDNNYSLVLMAEKQVPSPFRCTAGVLLRWSPPLDCQPDSTSGWTIKVRARENADRFKASVVFLCKGNAVWGDLQQGILYCDSRYLIDVCPRPVDVKCNMLPPECRDLDHGDDPDMFRTMGCVGDSIWFVIIHTSYTHPDQTAVKVWTLDVLSEEEKWKQHREFKMQDLWKMDEFKEKRLPLTLPKHPMLRQEDHGVLYIALPDFYSTCHAYLLGIDLSCDVIRLVMRTRLSVPWMDRFVFLDLGFFSRSVPLRRSRFNPKLTPSRIPISSD